MLNLALGLDVRWIPEPVDADRHFDRYDNNLVVSCVDNHQARQAIHEVRGCGIYAGNHADAGQVCIGNTGDLDLLRQYMDDGEGRYRYLPNEGLLFPDMLQPEPESAAQPAPNLSCAELVERGDQHLLVNGAPVVGR